MEFVQESKHAELGAVNENLYSRQLYVLGRAAQQRLQNGKVLVSGNLGGLGIEIAKNLILAGVHSVFLHDESPVTISDLSTNCFLTEKQVVEGVKRSVACLEKLRQLNSHVHVEAIEGEISLNERGYGSYNVVVAVNECLTTLNRLGTFCHECGIAFCATGVYGLYGYAFSDFGHKFLVRDTDGENARGGIVVDAENSTTGVVTTNDELHHGLQDGDLVRFSGVKGMSELNDGVPRRVKLVQTLQYDKQTKTSKMVDGFAFSIGDTSNYGKYLGGGNYEQVKEPVERSHRAFAESLDNPSLVQNEWTDLKRPELLHKFFQVLLTYEEQTQGFQQDFDTQKLKKLVEEACPSIQAPSASDLFEKLARSCLGHCCATSSYFGGIVGQEVVKAITQKFTPLSQWLHCEFTLALPDNESGATSQPTPRELSASGEAARAVLHKYRHDARYLGQISIFGTRMQEKLGALRCFLVGAGALGCEWLKLLALMGVSTADLRGKLTVTDMDGIEVSNLNRQFLFRDKHVGCMKSVIAAEQANEMNNQLLVEGLQHKVAPETEDIFGNEFWSSLDVVINALDNIQARMYVDSKCVFFKKPLLESGTLGSKGNSLPIVPDMTESYASSPVRENPNDNIPACTLHAYPNLIEHTLTWARDAVFERYFHLDPQEAKTFQEHRNLGKSCSEYLKDQPASRLASLRAARNVLVGIEPTDHQEKLFPYKIDLRHESMTFSTLVQLARMRFEELFVNKILTLLAAHPLDKTVDDQGKRFWSGKRRPPKVIRFDPENPSHVLFIMSSVKIYSRIYSVQLPDDLNQKVKSQLERLPNLPEFTLDGDYVVPENDAEAKALAEAKQKELNEKADFIEACCADELEQLREAHSRTLICPEMFDKDDDDNGHMDVIYAASMIRADSYGIPLVDKLKAKQIVGRIVPAIATTTAMITGSIAFELYKLLANKPLEAMRCTNINLAVNSYASFEPNPCKAKPFGRAKDSQVMVSLWTMLTLKGDLTIQGVLDYFLEEFHFEVTSISTKGDVSLYNDLFGQDERLGLKITSLFKELVGSEPPSLIPLTIDGDFEILSDEESEEEEDEEELNIPPCRLDWS